MDCLGISVGAGNFHLLPDYAKAGIRMVEISLPNIPIDGQRLLAAKAFGLLADSGMTLWSVHLPFARELDISNPEEEKRLFALEKLYPTVDLARGLGAKTLVVHGSSEPNTDESRPARMAACARSLDALSAYAHGMDLAVENLPRTCIGRAGWEVKELSAHCAGVCFDVNHLLIEDHAAFMEQALDRVITTHLSDYDGIDERHWLPGMGIVPWKMVREKLLARGYTGPFLFELGNGSDGKPHSPKDVVAAWEKVTQS